MKYRILEEQLSGQTSYKIDTIQNTVINFQNLFYLFGLQDLVFPTALYNLKVNGYTELGIFWLARELVMFNWSPGNQFYDSFLQG